MYYYIENTKTKLSKYISFMNYRPKEWVEIHKFYNNHKDYIIILIHG